MKKIFMDRCPKDEVSAKHLVCKKALPIPEENLKNLFKVGTHPLSPWPSHCYKRKYELKTKFVNWPATENVLWIELLDP